MINAPVSFISLADADTYFSTRPNSSCWINGDFTEKQNSLYAATRAMNRLRFIGVKTNFYNYDVKGLPLVDQPLAFPRNGFTEIPQEILEACCECAIAFLDGIDIDSEIRAMVVESQAFASVRQTKRQNFIQPYLLAGIPSATAWMMLTPFLSDPRAIRLVRAFT